LTNTFTIKESAQGVRSGRGDKNHKIEKNNFS
jgi:hypothetical protein